MNNFYILLAIILSIFSQGCMADCQDQYYYDPNGIREDAFQIMENAKEKIEQWAKHKIVFIPDSNADSCRVDFLYDGKQISMTPKAIGYTTHFLKNIQIEVGDYHDKNVIVLVHEILHSMRMGHVSNKNSIMHYIAGWEWTPEDQKECEEQGVCFEN